MSDSGNFTRRSVLAGLAGAAGITALGGRATGASPIDGRYIIDTASVSGSQWESSGEVIRELPLFDLAIVRAAEEDLTGLRSFQDFEIQTSPPERLEVDADADVDEDQIEREFTAGGVGSPSSHQWDKQVDQDIPSVHNQGITGDGATISIIDDGVASVDDLAPNIDRTRSATIAGPSQDGLPASENQNHGTEVASVAAGTGDLYVLGVAPEATIIGQNVFGSTPGAGFGDILTGIENSIQEDADVINLSLGTPLPFPSPTVDTDLLIESYERVADAANEAGAMIVSSAGNEGVNLDTADGTSLPTQVPGFFSVAATGPLGFVPEQDAFNIIIDLSDNPNRVNGGLDAETHLPATYTSFGANSLDVSAAGGNLLNSGLGTGAFNDAVQVASQTGILDLGFTLILGTSFSAPQVAGQAALVYSQNPDVAPQQVRQHIRNTAEQIPVEYNIQSTDTYFGPEGQLPEEYSSEVYRGDGHVDILRSATKQVPFSGGLSVGSEFNERTVFPADPDDDGLYEDVNGDGVVDMDDAQVLYELALRGAPADADRAFDFNGDGQFDMRDVQAFIRQL